MYRVTRIIIAAALWACASHTAMGASDHSGDPAAGADRGAEADGIQANVAYLHSLRLVDESGDAIVTVAFDRKRRPTQPCLTKHERLRWTDSVTASEWDCVFKSWPAA